MIVQIFFCQYALINSDDKKLSLTENLIYLDLNGKSMFKADFRVHEKEKIENKLNRTLIDE